MSGGEILITLCEAVEAYEETQKPYGIRPTFKIMNRYAKQLELYMDTMDVTDEDVYCDKTRLN